VEILKCSVKNVKKLCGFKETTKFS